jgi:hypothetical protein
MALENDRYPGIANKPLKQWQDDLFVHFNQLHQSRKNSGLSVFALEHGIAKTHLQYIFDKLKQELNANKVNRSNWLLWVVYATELGYNYDGDEYWQSFQDQTPNWNFNLREDIRWAFTEFHKRLGGVKPSGPWANHFSIISWPITHAILPKDLLAYFARLLYETRWKLVKTKLDDALVIGRLLLSNAHNIHSQRFHNFLQQEELVGRIALAILDSLSMEGNFDRIYSPTLKRIVSDLEKRGHAKEWLNVVRRDIKTRIVGASNSDKEHSNASKHTAPYQKKTFFKPRLSLRRAGTNNWDAIIDFPSFSASLENSDFTKFLKKTRFRITGVESTWLPADELLYGVQRKLTNWPLEVPLIMFEKDSEYAIKLIRDDCKINDGPIWLFRIGSDGIAHEIGSKAVRPGSKYIMVFSSNNLNLKQFSIDCTVNCADVIAKEIHVPALITDEIEEQFKRVGLRIAKTIRIWPVGLPARVWDGEGISEWLTTETPCFEVTYDHPVQEFHIVVGNLGTVIKGKSANVPTFFKLPKLPAGRHTLIIKPVIKNASSDDLQGIIQLEVRDPISWTPGTLLHSGLNSFLDPPEDNLDSFLLSKSKLNVVGPANRNVSVSFEFYGGNRQMKTIGPKNFILPVSGNALNPMCSEAIKDEELQLAKRMKLIISADELGQRIHSFQRDIVPLRWLFKSKHGKNSLRIIDETDSPEVLQILFFSFEKPTEQVLLSAKDWLAGQETSLKGLVIANKGKHQHAIVLSPLESTKTLQGLGVSPILPRISQTNRLNSVVELGKYAQTWQKARCVNLIAHLHRQKVLDAIVHNILQSLCGSEWTNIESEFMIQQIINSSIRDFSSKIGNRSLADIMRFRIETKEPSAVRPDEEKKWFMGAVERCSVCKTKSLSYFAIKFAANPLRIGEYFSEDFDRNFRELEKNPVLIKSARFYALAISKIVDPSKTDVFLPAGWKW